MDRDRRLSLSVGAFALVALGALAAGILSLSAQQGIFKSRYRLVAYFDNVQGLVSGAQVWLAGTRVGQVERVELAPRPQGEPAVRVLLQIDESVHERIRADSVAQIGTIGLLGDQLVQISIGSSAEPALGAGSEIATLDPFDLNIMVSKGGRALDAIENLAANLNESLEEFQQTGATEKLGNSLAALSGVVAEVKDGDGMLHSLIYEPYDGSALSSFEELMRSLANITSEVEHGDGVMHSLIYDAPTEQDLVLQFLAAGARLNSILAKVDRGEGTLGLLLNDPTLYEELKLLVGGANRSTVVRSLIRMVSSEDE
jgi:phospholipid/cholesterol/gamma-HCH transport system substrate-binding protein